MIRASVFVASTGNNARSGRSCAKKMTVLALLAMALVLCSLGIGALRRRHHLEATKLRQSLNLAALRTSIPGVATVPEDIGLPAPVRRYLNLGLPKGTAYPSSVAMSQHGTLRTATSSNRWYAFKAVQHVAPAAQAFVWDARVATPLLHVRVLDSLITGKASGRVLLGSAVRLASGSDSPQLNSGALHRFLAEAVWYPWALLPSDALRWEAIDDRTARATVSVGKLSVSLEYRFGDDGLVSSVYSTGRWGRFRGQYARVPWEGFFSSYDERDGFRVPLSAEVGWHRDGRLELVWKGRVQSIAFETLQSHQLL